MKLLYTLILTVSIFISTKTTTSAQSFLDKVKKASESLDPEEIPFKFINATDQQLLKITVNHQLTGKKITYDKGIDAGEEATFNVLSGKSDLALIYFVEDIKFKKVQVKNVTIKGEDAWMKFENPDWSRYQDYKPDDLPEKVHACVKKIDADADGEYESYVYYEQMEKYPQVYFSKFDDNADGEIDRMVSPNYKNDRGVGTKWDTNGDGQWDSVHTRLYKGNAFIAHKEIVEYKGKTIWVLKNIVDPEQEMSMMRQEWDIDNDGKVDKIKHFKRDQNYSVIAEEWDYDADGTIDERIVFGQDADKLHTDENKDGNSKQETQYIYDLTGNLSKETYDFDGDGKPDKIVQYDRSCREGYDENGPIF